MPFFILFVGILLIVSVLRGTTDVLFSLVKKDFTGQPNFFIWVFAIFLIGAIGFVKQVRPISDALLLLVIIGIFFANKGFFGMIGSQLRGAVVFPGSGQNPGDSLRYAIGNGMQGVTVDPQTGLSTLPDLPPLQTLQ